MTGNMSYDSNEAYRQYTRLWKERVGKTGKRRAGSEGTGKFSRLSFRSSKDHRTGDEYVRAIKAANDAIPEKKFRRKIARMEIC